MAGDAVARDLTIRPAVAGDIDRILELVRISLGTGLIPRSREFWEWKHRRNPFGESPVLLAESDGELVGLRAFLRWEWEYRGEALRAVRPVDTATHPDWRGRGIFSRLTRELAERMRAEGVHFIFNTPNSQSRPGYLKLGWTSLGRTDLWIRPSARALVKLLRRLTTGSTATDRDSATANAGSATTSPGAVPGHSIDSFLADDAVLRWLEALPRPAGRLRTRRTAGFLRWRYGDIPGFEYRAAAEVRGPSGAMVIYRIKERGAIRELRLCDVLVGEESASVGTAGSLIRRIWRESAPDFASAMAVPGSPTARALVRCGFLAAPRLGPILTALPLNTEADTGPRVDPLRRRNWDPCIGDLELF